MLRQSSFVGVKTIKMEGLSFHQEWPAYKVASGTSETTYTVIRGAMQPFILVCLMTCNFDDALISHMIRFFGITLKGTSFLTAIPNLSFMSKLSGVASWPNSQSKW